MWQDALTREERKRAQEPVVETRAANFGGGAALRGAWLAWQAAGGADEAPIAHGALP